MIAREIFDHGSSAEIGKQNAINFKLLSVWHWVFFVRSQK